MSAISQVKPNHHAPRGVVLSSTPVYPSGLRGYTGRGISSSFDARSNGTGEVLPPRYPLKKGLFPGGPGGFPRAQLDYSTTSMNLLTNEKCEG
jgi:hypothetical protein